ncbi:unnamed protein product [Rotaria socialis]|uniref:Uncharacterized protein n=1 Tax=Rotaria socialis TaxID=392032 RepID=A0A821X566_9BILA|nr:unnamed protein product [Rotaria socialis]
MAVYGPYCSTWEGVNLHLTPMATSEKPYRLDIKFVDNRGIHLEAAPWLTLTNTDTVDVYQSQHFNTLYVEVCGNR